MFKTAYCRDTSLETKVTCIRSIERLEGLVEAEENAHALKIAGLKVRINDCQATIDSINAELASELQHTKEE